jgi:magnesium-transporting ATPase (P-type)
MASDFAIAQFRFLTPLLLVHGRWSYKRLARMINFFFYKNLLFGITIFVFNALTGFSGQRIYNDFFLLLYNVIFTAGSPIVIGIFDRDVDKAVCYAFPSTYKACQQNK